MKRRISIVECDGYFYGYEVKRFGRLKKLSHYPQGYKMTLTTETRQEFIDWYILDYLKTNHRHLHLEIIDTTKYYEK